MTTEQHSELIQALQSWGVPFLLSPPHARSGTSFSSLELVRKLILSDSERMKLAITAFYLIHPECAPDVRKVMKRVSAHHASLLQYYYMVAVYLQLLWERAVSGKANNALPDFFSTSLGLPAPTLHTCRLGLSALEEKFQQLVGLPLNYLSSFDALASILRTAIAHETPRSLRTH